MNSNYPHNSDALKEDGVVTNLLSAGLDPAMLGNPSTNSTSESTSESSDSVSSHHITEASGLGVSPTLDVNPIDIEADPSVSVRFRIFLAGFDCNDIDLACTRARVI